MVEGNLADLRRPDAVIIDKAGYEYMWPGEPYRLGRAFEMNDRRAILVGICKSSAPFVTLPVVYTRYSQAAWFVPRERNLMAIALGFIVGVAVAGQTFYLFTIENLKQFGALKAMGVNNGRIVGMILLQALLVGAIGYGFGMGLTAAFFESTSHLTHLAGLHMFWQVMAGTGGAVLVIVVLSSLLSIRRVLVLEPAVVFRG